MAHSDCVKLEAVGVYLRGDYRQLFSEFEGKRYFRIPLTPVAASRLDA